MYKKFMDHTKACNGDFPSIVGIPKEEYERKIDACWEKMRINIENEEIQRALDEEINKLLDKHMEQRKVNTPEMIFVPPKDGWYAVTSFYLQCYMDDFDRACANAVNKKFPFLLRHYPKISIFDKFCIKYMLRINRKFLRNDLFDGEYFRLTYRLPFCKEKDIKLDY